MANVILVVGPSGTGKSTAAAGLDPKETYLINGAGKPLPFEGSESMYKEGTNLTQTSSSPIILGVLDAIETKAPHIKNVIIDDSGFVMSDIYFEKAMEGGYNKFTFIAKSYQSILAKAKTMRKDLNICIMLHAENVVNNGVIVEHKPKTVGKMVDDQYSPESVVTIALYTHVDYDSKTGLPSYHFITNRCKMDGIVVPAKSPRGMFPELKMPNDLAAVFARTKEYYNKVKPVTN